MKFLLLAILLLSFFAGSAQTTPDLEKKSITIKKLLGVIKIDGEINDTAWKLAPLANKFTEFQPTPFKVESAINRSEVYFLYDNIGFYVGGYFHEQTKDSIAAELTGRDGFGNNDFVGIVLDTYNDKQNGFEYFLTPLNEQFDAKVAPNSNGNNEDFAWNAVWQSATKIYDDGWSFEMFIPYSAIRFGKKNIQD